MTASILIASGDTPGVAELPRPDRMADGLEPEERLVVCGISWERYLSFDKALGDERPLPRFYYLDGELEIMTTSNEHERVSEWISGFLDDYFLEHGIDAVPRGQATMRDPVKLAGAEADKSWCLGQEKNFPDLVLEVALTSGGVRKLDICQRFNVSEVWFWRRNRLEIFTLDVASKTYEQVQRSKLLPDLNNALIEQCLALRSWLVARKSFRAGRILE